MGIAIKMHDSTVWSYLLEERNVIHVKNVYIIKLLDEFVVAQILSTVAQRACYWEKIHEMLKI